MTQNNMSGNEMSMVASCDATDCRYNQERQCHAGQIQVGSQGGMAQCMTYDPQGEGSGMSDQPGRGSDM
ncbi:hypothetical protein HNR42_000184 [Deinobacterium chartae]|uniref:DUF1540 domain-containing protein n=1 Tax=Deinobacterium chartae TaxID=521158 RepID=A0A841HXW7_9DEIO|nr:DUF1540 domain-containing protein [Deinobacterium chartae]MBB6096772.1 hypothetical protein [Deinobacterium chartae]